MIAEWGLIAEYSLVEEDFWCELHKWDSPVRIWRFDANARVIIHGGRAYDIEYWQGDCYLYDLTETQNGKPALCLKFLRIR